MKFYTLIALGAILALSVCAQPKVDVGTEKEAVRAVLDEYVKSIETENMALYAKLVVKDTAMVNFGGFGKPIVGWESLKKVMEGQNEMLSDTKIEVSDLMIRLSSDGKLAWATCSWNLKAKMAANPVELPIRCTWILEKHDAVWLIVHFHKSMAAG